MRFGVVCGVSTGWGLLGVTSTELWGVRVLSFCSSRLADSSCALDFSRVIWAFCRAISVSVVSYASSLSPALTVCPSLT